MSDSLWAVFIFSSRGSSWPRNINNDFLINQNYTTSLPSSYRIFLFFNFFSIFYPLSLFFLNFFIIIIFFTLQYCIGFAIHQHASSKGVPMFPILNPPPISLPRIFLSLLKDLLGVCSPSLLPSSNLRQPLICILSDGFFSLGHFLTNRTVQNVCNLFFSVLFIYYTLQYCIGFAVHWHESTMGVCVFPILYVIFWI